MKKYYFIISLLISISVYSQKEDFTKKLYDGSAKLDNIKFKLVLSKVIMNYYVPEILDTSDLIVVRPRKQILTKEIKVESIFHQVDFNSFNKELPEVEILKGKLVTLIYSGGEQENLLLSKISRDVSSGGRKITQLNFTSEKSNNNTVNSEEVSEFINNEENQNPLEWNIVAHGNDVYLRLDHYHLNRLGVILYEKLYTSQNEPLIPLQRFDPVEFSTAKRNFLGQPISDKPIYLAKSPDQFFLNDDVFMLDPKSVIFLFKLVLVQ